MRKSTAQRSCSETNRSGFALRNELEDLEGALLGVVTRKNIWHAYSCLQER